ncbi:hypothetical protein BDU57DRAFT_513333 [Ampelomyces quisqualis]|uniref:Uncharacterized protein n=1 Tax=Ampelomyces quisqualis TaxID=50730 RepID=A0A6A5QZ97_AMPQU|nr:hypothetical protein BDU57DRAFT_513333 [Ampelomyces quisqualis]
MHDQPHTAAPPELRGDRTIKRKRLFDAAAAPIRKRRPQTVTANPPCPSPLVKVLREYGLLEVVVSELCADDLWALANTSKALNEAIMPRTVSLNNLLGRLKCSGKGVEIRNKCHQKWPCFEASLCTEHVRCGSTNTKHETETKSCVNCKVATCDECRIHCVYQTSFEGPCDPNDPAELPNFSGFVLLQPFEQPILSPHHLNHDDSTSEPRWQDPSKSGRGPYHDQGYLDVPFHLGETAPPEYIGDILDLDLGCRSLKSVYSSSHYTSPSPVVRSLDMVAEARKVHFCDFCFGDVAPSDVAGMQEWDKITSFLPMLPSELVASKKECRCTLRTRMLDRWLCARCYQAEEDAIESFSRSQSNGGTFRCRCGNHVQRVLCLWCRGEVLEQEEDTEKADH